MSDYDEIPDIEEQLRRTAESAEAGSEDDRAQAAAEDAAEQAEADRIRGERLDMLRAAIERGDSSDTIIRQACEAALSDDQVEELLRRLHAVRKVPLGRLRSTHKRIDAEVQEKRRRERLEDLRRQRGNGQGKNDPEIAAISRDFPLPLNGTVYSRHEDRIWAGRIVDAEGNFAPLHTPFAIDGQLYYPPKDIEGLRVSVLSSKNTRMEVDVQLGRLQDAHGVAEVMSRIADAGLRVTRKGREALLELLSTSFHKHTIIVIRRAGLKRLSGKRYHVASDGKVIE